MAALIEVASSPIISTLTISSMSVTPASRRGPFGCSDIALDHLDCAGDFAVRARDRDGDLLDEIVAVLPSWAGWPAVGADRPIGGVETAVQKGVLDVHGFLAPALRQDRCPRELLVVTPIRWGAVNAVDRVEGTATIANSVIAMTNSTNVDPLSRRPGVSPTSDAGRRRESSILVTRSVSMQT